MLPFPGKKKQGRSEAGDTELVRHALSTNAAKRHSKKKKDAAELTGILNNKDDQTADLPAAQDNDVITRAELEELREELREEVQAIRAAMKAMQPPDLRAVA